MSITVAPGSYTINLAVDPTSNNKKLQGGKYTWSISGNTFSTLVASNDGLSALLSIVNGETVLVGVTNQDGSRWQAGKLYLVGDQILDPNGNVQQVVVGTRNVPGVFTPFAGEIPQGGDDEFDNGGNLRAHAYSMSGIQQFGTVLNTDSSGVPADGDWPAGALQQAGSDTNFTHSNHPGIPTSAASVAFVAGGYSRGRNAAGQDNEPAGIESSNIIGYFDASGNFHKVGEGSDPNRKTIAEYSEIGAGGQKVYLDAAGNTHTGWQIARGTQTFSDNAGAAPTFGVVGAADALSGSNITIGGGVLTIDTLTAGTNVYHSGDRVVIANATSVVADGTYTLLTAVLAGTWTLTMAKSGTLATTGQTAGTVQDLGTAAVADGELVWQPQGPASNADTWSSLSVIGLTGALAPYGNYLLLPLT